MGLSRSEVDECLLSTNRAGENSSFNNNMDSETIKLTNELSANLRKIKDEERKKGKAVAKQIALWDSLLDARIRLQKAATAANRLPIQSVDIASIANSSHCQASLHALLEEATLLSDQVFDIQDKILVANESIQPPSRKRRKLSGDRASDEPNYDLNLREASRAAAALEHSCHPHLIVTLSKWSSKIQAVAPSVLLPSNRNAFSQSSQHLRSAAQLIDETLEDYTKLLARTQVRRNSAPRVGSPLKNTEIESDDVEPDVQTFDDTDFYQQLLRDVIDARGNGATYGSDWMSSQKLKKAKKRVDTKASKGRKIRYEPHERLQNFMVPVTMTGIWHEEQIDELFASLLGKGFEHATQQQNELDESEETVAGLSFEVSEALGDGFRVFG